MDTLHNRACGVMPIVREPALAVRVHLRTLHRRIVRFMRSMRTENL
jgi:hypothetical protein